MAAPLLLALALPVALTIAKGPDFGLAVHELRVVSVRPGGPAAAAGLVPGDRVAAVGDRSVANMAEFYAALAAASPHAPLPVTVTRSGDVALAELLPVRPTRGAMIRHYSTWVTGLAFLAIGWWVFLQRGDLVARNFFALCFIFAFFLSDVPDHPAPAYMHVKDHLRTLMQYLLPAYFLRFFLLFPSPDRRAPRAATRRVQRLLLVPGLVLFAAGALLEPLLGQAPGTPAHGALQAASLAYSLAFFLAGLVVFARRALRRDRPIQRTKMLVVLSGLAAGLLPFLAAMVLVNLVPDAAEGPWPTLALSLVLVPVSFGLAIMRYGALDAAFVVRAGLTYGLLTLLLLGAFFLVVFGLGTLLSRVFAVSAYPVLLVIAAGSSLAVQPLRRLVQDWIDRTFYPARRVHRRAVARLGDELAGLIELDDVVATLGRRLRDLYRPAGFAVHLSAGPGRDFAAADGGPALPPESALAQLLGRLRRPVFTEEAEDLLFTGDADASSLSLLTRLDAVLLVPLVSGNRLVGFLSFGVKGGGALYSQEDLHNLRGLALQAGSLLESRRFYRDVLEQQRLEAELAVARDIQARLLPTGPLVTPAYAIAGRNVPCQAVGGDYYDYFLRENGHLALAIADVAGKGVPAALLMTSLCTSFRREAEGGDAPAAVVRRLNALVGERVTPGRFVCFFFADLDPACGLLRYCNAGMDPPVLLRPGGGHHQRLRKGGPVLGAAADHPYREGVLQLADGDQLFLHTDGLTDERNPSGEFFDLERLLAAVAAAREAAPDAALDQVFAAVEAFGAGSESDDKTAILLSVKELRNSLGEGPLLARAGRDPVDTRGLPGAR
ncbi:MAG: SpoIIE family protein phosphatase [Candidatus Krumholzibacteriia bacterium]